MGVVLVDFQEEMTNTYRTCMAYAISVARLTGRAFVLPAVRNGYGDLPLPDPRPGPPEPDWADFFDVEPALDRAGVPALRARDFQARFRVKTQDGKLLCRWRAGGDCSVAIFNESETEESIASRLAVQPPADILFLKRTWLSCHCLPGESESSQPDPEGTAVRHEIELALDRPRRCLREYAVQLLSLFGPEALVVHWRSMLPRLATSLLTCGKKGLPERERQRHHQSCVHDVIGGASSILERAGGPAQVVLFSDVHTGCQGGACTYVEFDGRWRCVPDLAADREEALRILDAHNWTNGDDVVVRHMLAHPIFPRDNVNREPSLLGIVIMEMLSSAPRLLMCAEDSCSDCAKFDSKFVMSLRGRRQHFIQRNPEAESSTWFTWKHPKTPSDGNIL